MLPSSRYVPGCSLMLLPADGFQGTENILNPLLDVELPAAKLLKFLSFPPCLRQFLFQIGDTGGKVIVRRSERPDSFLNHRKLFVNILHSVSLRASLWARDPRAQ